MAGESTTGNGSATMGNVGNHAAMGNGQPNHNGSLASPVPFLRCCNVQCESEMMGTVKVKVNSIYLDFHFLWAVILISYYMIENIGSGSNTPYNQKFSYDYGGENDLPCFVNGE